MSSEDEHASIYHFKENSLLSLFTVLELKSLITSNLLCTGHCRTQLQNHYSLWIKHSTQNTHALQHESFVL